MNILWLILSIMFLLVEAITVHLVCIWFAIGALVTLILSYFIQNIYIQWFVFLLISLISLIALRPLAKDKINNFKQNTNYQSLIGRKATLIETISPEQFGKIKINDVYWVAVTENEDETINKGDKVKIINIKGNKLIVEKL